MTSRDIQLPTGYRYILFVCSEPIDFDGRRQLTDVSQHMVRACESIDEDTWIQDIHGCTPPSWLESVPMLYDQVSKRSYRATDILRMKFRR